MSVVEQFEQLIEIAQQLGYRIRYDYFGGTGGGICEFGGTRWMLIDLGMSSVERLEKLQSELAEEPLMGSLSLSRQQQEILGWPSKAA